MLEFNGPSWSLSVEALFYAVFPFVLTPLARLEARRLFPASVALTVLGVAVGVGCVAVFRGQPMESHEPGFMAAKYLPLVHLPAFLFGAVLGRLFLERPSGAGSDRALALLGWGALVALVVVAFVPGLYLFKHSGGLIPLFGALIWALAHERGTSARLLAHPLLVLLGEASYGLYILHLPLTDWWGRLGDRLHLSLSVVDSKGRIAFVFAAILVAVLVYRLYELPARAWIRARFTRLSPRPVA